jgi:hypothetical protein
MTITFHALENRTPTVTFAADILDSNYNSVGAMAFTTTTLTEALPILRTTVDLI